MEVGLVQEHVPDLDPAPLADITTADVVAQGPTVLAHALALTVAVQHLADISPRHSSPTSSPRPATIATASPSPAGVTATAAEEDPATRGSAHVLGPGPALRSRWTGTATERGNVKGTEIAAPSTSRRRNTNTTEELAIGETGGRGRDLGPMTGTERGSVATRANTTAVVDTQDTAVTGAETQPTSSRTDSHSSIPSRLKTKSGLVCSLNVLQYSLPSASISRKFF